MSAVERTVRILEVLSRAGAINLENLSRETDLPKATLLRFLGRFLRWAMSAGTMRTATRSRSSCSR